MTTIGIINCNVNNLTSVRNAFHHIGVECVILDSPESIRQVSHIVLPGVGSYATGMYNLRAAGLIEPIREHVASGKSLLGLCLGMQLLAEMGDEFGPTEGLGFIPERVVRMNSSYPDVRLPHVGWNDVVFREGSRLIRDGHTATFYFVHSYCYRNPYEIWVSGVTDYGGPVAAVVEYGNVYGVQFHPEKSQKAGLELLRTYVERC